MDLVVPLNVLSGVSFNATVHDLDASRNGLGSPAYLVSYTTYDASGNLRDVSHNPWSVVGSRTAGSNVVSLTGLTINGQGPTFVKAKRGAFLMGRSLTVYPQGGYTSTSTIVGLTQTVADLSTNYWNFREFMVPQWDTSYNTLSKTISDVSAVVWDLCRNGISALATSVATNTSLLAPLPARLADASWNLWDLSVNRISTLTTHLNTLINTGTLQTWYLNDLSVNRVAALQTVMGTLPSAATIQAAIDTANAVVPITVDSRPAVAGDGDDEFESPSALWIPINGPTDTCLNGSLVCTLGSTLTNLTPYILYKTFTPDSNNCRFRVQLGGRVSELNWSFAGVCLGNSTANKWLAFGRCYTGTSHPQYSTYLLTPGSPWTKTIQGSAVSVRDWDWYGPQYVEMEYNNAVGSGTFYFRLSTDGLNGTFRTVSTVANLTTLFGNSGYYPNQVGYVWAANYTNGTLSPALVLTSAWIRRMTPSTT